MSDLLTAQWKFSRMLPRLIDFAFENGYYVSMGECKRSDEQAEINAIGDAGRKELARLLEVNGYPILALKIANNTGSGIRGSLHEQKLAVDLDLFDSRGRYVGTTEAHRPLGEFWESIGGTWGGHFGDGNHYSVAFGGKK